MAKNKPVEFMTFLDYNTVRVYLPGGKTMNVELSESGVATFREVIERDYAMLRWKTDKDKFLVKGIIQVPFTKSVPPCNLPEPYVDHS